MTSPRASSTVMITSLPIITLSPARLVSTSIVGAPSIRGRTASRSGAVAETRDRAGDGTSVGPIHGGADRQAGTAENHLHGAHAVAVHDDRRQQVRGGLVDAGRDHRQQQQTVRVL